MPGDFDSRFGSFHVSHWGGTDTQLAALTRRAMLALLRDCRRHPFAEAVWRRARAMDPASLRADDGLRRLLRHLRLRLDRLAGQDRRRQNWGDAALASSLRLQPGESRDVHFVLGWHFPVHYSQLGPDLGHRYEAWFADAEAVARHLVAGRKAQRGATVGFADTLFDTNLLPELPDAWAGQLTTIPKCTWWTRHGSFGVWEGLGCCGFHTTDITYQGSFNLLALFPDLQKQQMEMGARFQRADGRVHHFFRPDFSRVDEGFDRVDMNQQFVLLVCRDYLDRKLWNGEYYSLWVDGDQRDECCMTDQVDGERFTNLIGLGYALPRERIVAALGAVFRHNFREDGLVNASYPAGAAPRLCTHNNIQALAPWTGIEYAIASMMMEAGLLDEATAVARNVHERYLRAGRFWNHVECGGHYYRAMSSWALLLAATGLKLDVPRQALTIVPAFAERPLRAPWVSATGWGTLVQHPDGLELVCRAGTLAFRSLAVRLGARPKDMTLDGRQAGAARLTPTEDRRPDRGAR